MERIVARWQGWSDGSLEHLCVQIDHDEIVAQASFISNHAEAFAARYRIVMDSEWRTRRVEVDIDGGRHARVLIGDGQGNWHDGAGRSLMGLHRAIDVDLSITPFTNTLPIRRLVAQSCQSADIVTAWMSFPDLAVQRDPQRYTCLEATRLWRYESRDSDFCRELEVDANGLVMTYPGLFRRVL